MLDGWQGRAVGPVANAQRVRTWNFSDDGVRVTLTIPDHEMTADLMGLVPAWWRGAVLVDQGYDPDEDAEYLVYERPRPCRSLPPT